MHLGSRTRANTSIYTIGMEEFFSNKFIEEDKDKKFFSNAPDRARCRDLYTCLSIKQRERERERSKRINKARKDKKRRIFEYVCINIFHGGIWLSNKHYYHEIPPLLMDILSARLNQAPPLRNTRGKQLVMERVNYTRSGNKSKIRRKRRIIHE